MRTVGWCDEAASFLRQRSADSLAWMLGVSMGMNRDVTITLTAEQIARVVLEASGTAAVTGLLTELDDLQGVQDVVLPLLEDVRLSHSTLRALLVLAAFPIDGTEREITHVAKELRLSASTTHRYATTWVAVGLLEQNQLSRRYRRPVRATRDALPIR